MGYLDNTGTYVKIGTEVAVPSTGGEYRTYGELREIEFKLDLTKAPLLSAGPLIVNDNFFFPKGVVIQEAEVYMDAAAAGSSSTLDVGLMATDRVTEIDFNGILVAETVAHLVIGTKLPYIKGNANAGALVGGSATTTVGYVCMNYNVAVFSAGTMRLRIRYFRP